ncbi:MAG TPA: VCBS repeat-containing protein, partial [Myxococcota bacterium]|nr:VCBS repeat-containing protein [Myxococcota bacterium]
MRARLAAIAVACALAAAGCKPKEAGLYVTVSGAVFDIATLHVVVTAQSSGRAEVTDFAPPQGQATIALPVTFTLLLQATRAHAHDGALSGPFEVCVTPRDASGGTLRNDVCAVENVAPDAVTEFVIDFGPIEGDAGSDAGSDGAVDAGADAGPGCGDGVRSGAEVCDGADLAGNDCTSIGMGFIGGALACDASCAFDTAACERSHPDFNGDGYADVIVGAGSASGTGRAYVYFGSPGATLDPAPDGTLTGEAAGDDFGYAVASAGDVNGDGFDDVVVGAPLSDGSGIDAGRAYVYLGGPGATFDPAPDGTLDGDAVGDYFGFAVASAGDVNGDGFIDIFIGAPRNDAAGVDAGCARVYLGGAGLALDPAPDATLTGEAADDRFGDSVAPAGDVNGDGFGDIVVGAPLNDAAGTIAGRAYVYLGGPGATIEPTPDGTLTGASAGDSFGYSVAGAGDVNGDGFDDVVVGAYVNDAGGTNAGRAYVYLGGPGATIDLVADGIFTGEAAGDYFGYS